MTRIIASLLLIASGVMGSAVGDPGDPEIEMIAAATYPDQYVPREIVIGQGWGLRFVGSDRVLHDLESFDTDELGRPLFSTNGPVPLGASATVIGVQALEPGPYLFLCNLHDGMTGRLVVDEAL